MHSGEVSVNRRVTKLRYAINLIPLDPEVSTLNIDVFNLTGGSQGHYERKGVSWEECRRGLKSLELDPGDKPDLVPQLFREGAVLCTFHSQCNLKQLADAGLIA
jgi:hypothetical protein